MRKYEEVPCPLCGAGIGEYCRSVNGGYVILVKHKVRRELAEQAPAE